MKCTFTCLLSMRSFLLRSGSADHDRICFAMTSGTSVQVHCGRWIFSLLSIKGSIGLQNKTKKNASLILQIPSISTYLREPSESGQSLERLMRTGTHTQSDVRVSARERENVAGRARGRELREREDGSHCENHFRCFFTQQYFCRGCHI